MDIAWIILKIVVNLVESSLLVYLFCHQLKSITPSRVREGACVVFVALCVNSFLGHSYSMQTITYMLAGLIFLFYSFKSSFTRKTLWCLFPVCINTFSKIIVFFIFAFSGIQVSGEAPSGMVRISAQLFYCLLLCLFYFTAANAKVNDEERVFHPTGLKIYIIVLIILAAISIQALYELGSKLSEASGGQWEFNATFISLVVVLFIISFIMLFARLGTLQKKHVDTLMETNRMEMQLAHMKEAEISFDMLRVQDHELKGHLDIMANLLENKRYEDLAWYFAEYKEKQQETPFLAYTGNPTLNACLTVKGNRAKKLGIAFSYYYDVAHEIPMSATDLCSLVGNMLDNAIDACQLLQQGAYITLTIEERGWMVVISVENSASNVHAMQEGTSTKGQGHGLGLKIIRKLLSKANGVLIMDPQGEKVVITAMLPLAAEQIKEKKAIMEQQKKQNNKVKDGNGAEIKAEEGNGSLTKAEGQAHTADLLAYGANRTIAQ